MVDVIKDSRKWMIQVNLENKDCPYLYFPANYSYHGCRIEPVNKKGFCTFENCPVKKERGI